MTDKKRLRDALTDAQGALIAKSMDPNYPMEESIADIDTIADLTEMKIKLDDEMECPSPEGCGGKY